VSAWTPGTPRRQANGSITPSTPLGPTTGPFPLAADTFVCALSMDGLTCAAWLSIASSAMPADPAPELLTRGTAEAVTISNPLGLIHVEAFRRVGNVQWSDAFSPSERRAYPIPCGWPRCFACELTDEQFIIPALAVTRDGIPVCIAHFGLGGMPGVSLRPPCVVCGEPVETNGRAFTSGHYIPVEGYVCKVHRHLGRVTPPSAQTWKSPDGP